VKRVLIILPNLDRGGTEAVVMEYFRHIDGMVFDFVVHGEAGFYEAEARSLGARIFRVPTRKQGFFKNIAAMRKIYKNYPDESARTENAPNHCDFSACGEARECIRGDVQNQSVADRLPIDCEKIAKIEEKYETVIICTEHAFAFIELFVAWISGVETRAAWSHFSDYQGASRLKRRAHFFARPFMRLFANKFLACTKDAGIWLFGKFFAKNLHKPQFHIINNAIDLRRAARPARGGSLGHAPAAEHSPEAETKSETRDTSDSSCRDVIRAAHGIPPDELVIVIAGRLTAVKNHEFALAVFAEILNNAARLFIIGGGELRGELEARVCELGLSERVIFTGAVDNIYEYYQASDVLILPSFHEGLPVVAVEAQASGLPVLLSDAITRDVKISDLAHYKALSDGAPAWAEKIVELTAELAFEKRIVPDLSDSGFDITREAVKFREIFTRDFPSDSEFSVRG